jgi:xanthine dehydrogenase YagR molybdenum-binding subunit
MQVKYAKAKGAYDLATAKDSGQEAEGRQGYQGYQGRRFRQGAFDAAPVKLDATYTTPDQSHAMMEPHASIAAWEGDKLTCGPRTR